MINEMKNSIYQQLGGTYHEENGLLYPNLALPEQTHYPIGKYGDLHLAYLKEHKRVTYATLLTSGTLNEYLHKIDEQAREVIKDTVARLASERGVNEALKAENPLLWVQEMNNCKSAAEEIVLREVIYQ